MKLKNIYLFIFFILAFLSLLIIFTKKFFLGMDIAGGTILTYQIDLSNIEKNKIQEILEQSKDLIERRINFLGVGEFFISYSDSGKILIEIPNIKNPEDAIKIIGETPLLDFRIPLVETTSTEKISFIKTELTGRYLQKAEVIYNPQTLEPAVSLYFNPEGSRIFKELTQKYLGQPIAIFLDNQLISAPIVKEVINNGNAQITGNFTLEEAKTLVRRLNQGALPAPLSLEAVSIVDPMLGEKFLDLAIKASVLGTVLVILFMIIVYGFNGLIASIALLFFILYNLALYKILNVTISLASLSGFLLTIGMAVDANILIFERTKEEIRKGLKIKEALKEGFDRAFPSIRDSNMTTIISALVIYFLATSFVRGFALTLFLGTLISFLTAVFFTRSLLEILRK